MDCGITLTFQCSRPAAWPSHLIGTHRNGGSNGRARNGQPTTRGRPGDDALRGTPARLAWRVSA